MGDWDAAVLSGPDGEDWRVPVSELENRLERLARALRVAALPGAPVDPPQAQRTSPVGTGRAKLLG